MEEITPKNMLLLQAEQLIVPTETLSDVLENILISGSKKDRLIEKMRNLSSKVASKVSKSQIEKPATN